MEKMKGNSLAVRCGRVESEGVESRLLKFPRGVLN